MSDYAAIAKEAAVFTEECVTNNRIDPSLFGQYNIKRGLRDQDGKGVLAGITNISRIDAFEEKDGKKVPCDGKLWYRGYNVYDLIRGLRGKRYAFEEALTRGNLESVEHYLDPINTRNSNELKVLFLRWKQETRQTEKFSYDTISAYRAQIYNEILDEMNALTSKLRQAASNVPSQKMAM